MTAGTPGQAAFEEYHRAEAGGAITAGDLAAAQWPSVRMMRRDSWERAARHAIAAAAQPLADGRTPGQVVYEAWRGNDIASAAVPGWARMTEGDRARWETAASADRGSRRAGLHAEPGELRIMDDKLRRERAMANAAAVPDHPADGWADLVGFINATQTSFGGRLLDLAQHADPQNLDLLRNSFPFAIRAWETWRDHSPETWGELAELIGDD